MPRPKLVSDTEILDATRRVMQRHGGIWWNNERYVIVRKN